MIVPLGASTDTAVTELVFCRMSLKALVIWAFRVVALVTRK